MTNNVRIAYGYLRSDRDFKSFNITDNKIFIDNENTDREELRAALVACREGMTLVVLQVSDFGPGAKAKQIREAMEAKGVTLEVPVAEPKKRGRKLRGEISTADEKWARAIFMDLHRTRTSAVKRINDRTGLELTYDQLYYRFIGAKRRKKKFES